MNRHVLRMIMGGLLILGGLHLGTQAVFKTNLLERLNDFVNFDVETMICILIGLSALFLLLDRNFYLPFLGESVVPHSLLVSSTNTGSKKYILQVDEKDAVKVIYWAANKGEEKDQNQGPEKAYNGFKNSGITNIVNNSAILHFDCPQQYRVGLFNKKLPKHLHYRIVYNNGFISDIKTINLTDQC